MSMIHFNNTNNTLQMPEMCTIYQVRLLKDQLLTLKYNGDSLTLDFSDTKEIDAAGIQLLIALNQYFLDRNIMLTCDGFSEDLFQLLTLYNPPFPVNIGEAS